MKLISTDAGCVTNSDIAGKLLALAQLLAEQRGNQYKAKAYRRAAKSIQNAGVSFAELVHDETDLTTFPGIGTAIASALGEIVRTGTLRQLDALRAEVPPERAALLDYPFLDPKRVLRIYKKLKIDTLEELRVRLESGELLQVMGARTEQHVRQAMLPTERILLYDADKIVPGIEEFLVDIAEVKRVEAAGEYRRRVEVVSEILFLVETRDFQKVITALRRYGGGMECIDSSAVEGSFRLPSGIALRVRQAVAEEWGAAWIRATGSAAHVESLSLKDERGDEAAVYAAHGFDFIEPELRERAAGAKQPRLVSVKEIVGELHAHSVSSDGRNTIAEMAAAAKKRGYRYIGISDHSQSLKIAGGLTEAELWLQIKAIDQLNEKQADFRILKSAEVDILADGSLDYPDDLLRELDYTVCSIHSKFSMGKEAQTERVMRAMDNRYFTMLGHATGRLLLKRPGYELDFERIVEHAKQRGCFFEINSSPDRLDLSAENARMAAEAGIRIAINTDAHSIYDMDLIRYGVGQARRAGLTRDSVLNCLGVEELLIAMSHR